MTIDVISRRMSANTLHELRKDQLVRRTVSDRVTYSIGFLGGLIIALVLTNDEVMDNMRSGSISGPKAAGMTRFGLLRAADRQP